MLFNPYCVNIFISSHYITSWLYNLISELLMMLFFLTTVSSRRSHRKSSEFMCKKLNSYLMIPCVLLYTVCIMVTTLLMSLPQQSGQKFCLKASHNTSISLQLHLQVDNLSCQAIVLVREILSDKLLVVDQLRELIILNVLIYRYQQCKCCQAVYCGIFGTIVVQSYVDVT